MKFTQKYGLIQLFEDMSVDTEFSYDKWPLHSTVADVFAIDWDVPTMVGKLAQSLSSHPSATSTAQDDTFFGPEKEVHVVLLKKTESLLRLHADVIACLEKGGWVPNRPDFAKDNFLPHSTVQKHIRLNQGDKVRFDALALIDFFPDQDPYKRRVLAIIPIGQ